MAGSDSGTVRAQLQAVRNATPELAEDFAAFARAAARVAGTLGVIEEALE